MSGHLAGAQAVDQLNTGQGDNNASQIEIQGGTGQPGDESLQIKPRGSGEAELQIGTPDSSGSGQEQINSGNQGGVAVDQPKGQDLCDPSVPAWKRRAAGVNCDKQIQVQQNTANPGLTNDPLLTPREKTVGDEFESLDLGDDVPSTVILQN